MRPRRSHAAGPARRRSATDGQPLKDATGGAAAHSGDNLRHIVAATTKPKPWPRNLKRMRPAYTPIERRDVERRRAPRQRTLLAARLGFDQDCITIACGVRNLSESGALIELESPALLKPPFKLLTVRDGVIREADICWSWGKRFGLHFTAVHEASAPVSDDLLRLRQIGRAIRA